MDVAVLSMSMSQARLMTEVQISVLSKSIDVVSTEAEGLKKMMEMSVNPGLGANLDVQV